MRQERYQGKHSNTSKKDWWSTTWKKAMCHYNLWSFTGNLPVFHPWAAATLLLCTAELCTLFGQQEIELVWMMWCWPWEPFTTCRSVPQITAEPTWPWLGLRMGRRHKSRSVKCVCEGLAISGIFSSFSFWSCQSLYGLFTSLHLHFHFWESLLYDGLVLYNSHRSALSL